MRQDPETPPPIRSGEGAARGRPGSARPAGGPDQAVRNDTLSALPGAVPRRVWSGAGLQVAGRLFGSGCTALILFLLARALPIAAFGRYTFFLSLFGLVESWADGGTSTAIVQRTAHDVRLLSSWLRAGRRLRLFGATLAWVFLVGLAFVFEDDGRGWIALAALYPFSRVAELSAVVYQHRIAWSVPVATRALAGVLRLGLSVLLIHLGVQDAALFLCVHAFGPTVGNLVLWVCAEARLRAETAARSVALPEPESPRERVCVRGLFAIAWPLGLTAIAQQAYVYVDNLFLRALASDTELGHYNAAARVVSLLVMLGAFATSTALPWFTRAHREGALGEAVGRLGQGLALPAAVVLGALVPWADRLLALLFSDPYAAGDAMLRWLFVAAFAIYLGAPLLTALLATGATRRVLSVVLVALVLNMLGNALLVPRLGAEGAALATLGTELWIGLGAALALAREGVQLRFRPWAWGLAPLAFGAAWIASDALRSFAS